MIVVDSSVWIASLLKNASPAVRSLQSITRLQDIVVGDLILLEVLQGTRDDIHAARIEKNLRQFRVEPMLGPVLAVAAARHFRHLRAAGVTIRKTVDLIIAAFCIDRGYALLHQDRDFDRMRPTLPLQIVPLVETGER